MKYLPCGKYEIILADYEIFGLCRMCNKIRSLICEAYFIREAYFILRSNISLVPSGTNFIEKSTPKRAYAPKALHDA